MSKVIDSDEETKLASVATKLRQMRQQQANELTPAAIPIADESDEPLFKVHPDSLTHEERLAILAKVKSTVIYNEQTGRLEPDPTEPPHIQASDEEQLLEMDLMGSFNRMGSLDTLGSFVDKIRNDQRAEAFSSFDLYRVRWQHYVEGVLEETKRADGQNFRRIRMLQNILSRA